MRVVSALGALVVVAAGADEVVRPSVGLKIVDGAEVEAVDEGNSPLVAVEAPRVVLPNERGAVKVEDGA